MTPTNRCLDGETLAAWVEGGLARTDAAMAEAHVSSCPRCQEIAGLIVKTTPATIVDVPWWRRRAAWLVPATVGITAAGLLMIVPANPTPGPAPPAVTAPPATAALESAQKADSAATPAAPPVAPPAQRTSTESRSAAANPAETKPTQATTEGKKERQRDERASVQADASPAAAASAGAPPAAAAATPAPIAAAGGIAGGQLARQPFGAAAGKQAVSPDGSLRWRITDRGAAERSTDGGTTWQSVNVGVTATFTTVQAPEPRTALVTTTDDRVFRTTDGGTTWRLVPR